VPWLPQPRWRGHAFSPKVEAKHAPSRGRPGCTTAATSTLLHTARAWHPHPGAIVLRRAPRSRLPVPRSGSRLRSTGSGLLVPRSRNPNARGFLRAGQGPKNMTENTLACRELVRFRAIRNDLVRFGAFRGDSECLGAIRAVAVRGRRDCAMMAPDGRLSAVCGEAGRTRPLGRKVGNLARFRGVILTLGPVACYTSPQYGDSYSLQGGSTESSSSQQASQNV